MFRNSVVRIVVALAVASAVVTYLGMPYISDVLSAGYRLQAENRARTLVSANESHLRDLVKRHDRAGMRSYLTAMLASDTRLLGLALCKTDGTLITLTDRTPADLVCQPEEGVHGASTSRLIETNSGRLQISNFEFDGTGQPLRVVVVQDLSFADWSRNGWRGFVFMFVAMLALALALLMSFIMWWLLRRWVAVLLSDLRGGRLRDDAFSPRLAWPILTQVREILRDAEESQRREIDYRENWTPLALRQIVQRQLQSSQVITVSNREPYSHSLEPDGQVKVSVPASGMVTALEPIMRACSGVWIAHGSGSADRERGRQARPDRGSPG